MERESQPEANEFTESNDSNLKFKRNKYKFAVVKLQNKSIDDYVCVPSSWVVRALDKEVIIKYPEEELSQIKKMVKRRSELSNIKCKSHKAMLVYETDSFESALKYIDKKKRGKSNRRHPESKSEDNKEHSAKRNDNSNIQQRIPKLIIKLPRSEHRDIISHQRRKPQTDSKSKQCPETKTKVAKDIKNIGKSNECDNGSIKSSTCYEPIASTSKDPIETIYKERTNENHSHNENNCNSTSSHTSLQPEKHCTEENKENYTLETESAQISQPSVKEKCNNETYSEKEILIERIDNNFNSLIDNLKNVSVSNRKKMLESYCSLLDIFLETSNRKAVRQ